MEYGLGCIIIRSPYTPYSIYLRGTIGFGLWGLGSGKHKKSVNSRHNWAMIWLTKVKSEVPLIVCEGNIVDVVPGI